MEKKTSNAVELGDLGDEWLAVKGAHLIGRLKRRMMLINNDTFGMLASNKDFYEEKSNHTVPWHMCVL